jgi:hypothetical protein
MGDLTIAQDILEGVADALADLGTTRQVRVTAFGALTPGDPGAGGAPVDTDFDVEAVVADYEEKYVDGAVIRAGDRQAVLSIGPLSAAQIAALAPGAKLLDGPSVYSVVSANVPEVAGVPVVAILHVRGTNG